MQNEIKALQHGLERPGNGVAGRGQELAQHQHHEGTLAGWQSPEFFLLQIRRHALVKVFFFLGEGKILRMGTALGIPHIVCYTLPPQCTLAHRGKSGFQVGKSGIVKAGILCPEGLMSLKICGSMKLTRP